MKNISIPRLITFVSILLLLAGCGRAEPTAQQETGAPSSDSTESASQATSDEAVDLTDARVEATLGLRSVEMELQCETSGGAENPIQASLDAQGNVYMQVRTPGLVETFITPENPDSSLVEIYIIDGEAYARMGLAGTAEPEPDQLDALNLELYGPCGPGLWLLLLPEENFTPMGSETVGGFNATRYEINGSIDAGPVTGEFWVDEASGALVGANLLVPEIMLRPVEEGTQIQATIVFTVQVSDVATVVLP